MRFLATFFHIFYDRCCKKLDKNSKLFFWRKDTEYHINGKTDDVWILYAATVILWHRHFSFCLMYFSSFSQHILPSLPLLLPSTLSEAISWRHNITDRHTSGPLQFYMSMHTHTRRHITTHARAGSHSLAHTHTQTISLAPTVPCGLWWNWHTASFDQCETIVWHL